MDIEIKKLQEKYSLIKTKYGTYRIDGYLFIDTGFYYINEGYVIEKISKILEEIEYLLNFGEENVINFLMDHEYIQGKYITFDYIKTNGSIHSAKHYMHIIGGRLYRRSQKPYYPKLVYHHKYTKEKCIRHGVKVLFREIKRFKNKYSRL